MAMTQSADVYAEAIDAGYNRRVAGFTALLAAGGQYALMSNNPMGDWFLIKLLVIQREQIKQQLENLLILNLKMFKKLCPPCSSRCPAKKATPRKQRQVLAM